VPCLAWSVASFLRTLAQHGLVHDRVVAAGTSTWTAHSPLGTGRLLLVRPILNDGMIYRGIYDLQARGIVSTRIDSKFE